MNRERLQMVRDRIAAEPPERLYMADFHCGTVHCIAGWEEVIDAEERGVRLDVHAPTNLCRERMGLSWRQAEKLFYPDRPHDRNQADALAALDSLITADSDDALPVWPEPRA